MSNLKDSTRVLINRAKTRRATLKKGARQHAMGSARPKAVAALAESRYRKAHADGLRKVISEAKSRGVKYRP